MEARKRGAALRGRKRRCGSAAGDPARMGLDEGERHLGRLLHLPEERDSRIDGLLLASGGGALVTGYLRKEI